MDSSSSFAPVENMLMLRAKHHNDFQYQEILLTRLCVHVYGKLLDSHNCALKAHGINESMLMALIALEAQKSSAMQPSELSYVLGASRANTTRIADELNRRGWIQRQEIVNDRRGLLLCLTAPGRKFLHDMLPPRYASLAELWSVLNEQEKNQLEQITRKVLGRLDQIKANSTTTQFSSLNAK